MVKKRDGSMEEFQREKIERVVVAAGLSEEQAKALSQNVVGWVDGQKDREITTLNIRDRVLEELKRVNKSAADVFEWYEKTKEK